ncbi:MAG: hypothetical protein WCT11_04245 [Candidatus Magasanikbacteria bacterium]|jgi:hypothetical protein
MRVSKVIVLVVAIALVMPSLAFAAMSSTNYYIFADSVDFGGGSSASTSYSLQDSLGGYATGISTSTSYQIRAGYQAEEVGLLSMVLDGSSVNFGTVSSVGLLSSNIIAVVNTNSITGYTLSILDVNGTSLSAVADGTVDGAGNVEEYGLAVSGTHVAYSNDVAILNGLVLSSVSSPAYSDTTTLIFKAARAPSSLPATYAQSIILSAAANI